MEFNEGHHPKTVTFIVIGIVAFFLFALSGSYLWAHQFEGRIAPNIFVGPVAIGGMTPESALQLLQSQVDGILANGLPIRVNETTETLSLSTLVSSDLIENVEFDLNETIQKAQKAKRSPNPFMEIWLLITSAWKQDSIPVQTTLAKEIIQQNIIELFPDKEKPGENAKFVFLQDTSNWQVRTVPGKSGVIFNWEAFFVQLETQLQQFDQSEIVLSLIETSPAVSQAGAEEQKDIALKKLLTAPITWTYTDERGKTKKWTMSRIELASILIPSSDGFTQIDQTAFNVFLDPIADEIGHSAQNARLQIENGRVVDFVESKSGQRLDREAIYFSFTSEFASSYELALVIEEPTIETSEVNDLGIDQILGTGTSSYRGSPSNRRKNIQNGVDLLDGTLIPPGETFSLVEALKPFDTENGYLPELVIKGTKITPELGGGLCQIGTTTFRAALNSGLPIIERRNHSLVVSYYNDPSNKNPGTDATIYDPAPDFKLKNDTNHYILFQAENLLDTQELRFTFWGTSDGRKGSYTPPVVHRWIPVGETQFIETTDLKPGEEKCQEAHIGADASFDYTVVHPDGTVDIQTFDSHYRPLPRICLVGIEPVKEELPLEGEVSSVTNPNELNVPEVPL